MKYTTQSNYDVFNPAGTIFAASDDRNYAAWHVEAVRYCEHYVNLWLYEVDLWI